MSRLSPEPHPPLHVFIAATLRFRIFRVRVFRLLALCQVPIGIILACIAASGGFRVEAVRNGLHIVLVQLHPTLQGFVKSLGDWPQCT